MTLEFIRPDWSAPKNIHAATTTRIGGTSLAPFDSLNLADHVGDDLNAVLQNRTLLQQSLNLPSEPNWLTQTHSTRVLHLPFDQNRDADASFTTEKNVICSVLTADCLPILLCDNAGTEIAAVHAGWRGLADGIIGNTLKNFTASPKELMAWIGPAICRNKFEIDDSVRRVFMHNHIESAEAFVPSKPDHWFLDLVQIARIQLKMLGVTHIYGGKYCTYSDANRFFSYRRNPETGRIATLIWMS
ncbi:MAG: peptidoglycan editing factor PgeF [Pseudomonadota bacterium]